MLWTFNIKIKKTLKKQYRINQNLIEFAYKLRLNVNNIHNNFSFNVWVETTTKTKTKKNKIKYTLSFTQIINVFLCTEYNHKAIKHEEIITKNNVIININDCFGDNVF